MMENRLLGRSGLIVSELCLGTMTFGNATNEEEAHKIIHSFLDAGGNFLDTANSYVGGVSEEIIGRALKNRRQEVVLATKARQRVGEFPNDAGYSRRHVLEQIDQSLRRLQTDYVDLYQLHIWDHLTPIDEVLRTLDDLISSGKVRYIGCSNFLAWQLMKALSVSDFRNYARFISIQPQYSIVNREMDREVLSLCQEEEIGFLPWAPLAGGFLSGKYTKIEEPTFGRFSETKVVGEYSWERKFTEHNFNILKTVKEVAEDNGKTMTQVSLRWLLQKQGVTAPIFGVRSFDQLMENLGSVDWTLSAEDWQRIDEASALPSEYPQRFIDKFSRKL